MFKNARKEDMQIAALEIGEVADEKMTIIELTNLLKNSEEFKKDPETVKCIVQNIVEERKSIQQNALEMERLKGENLKRLLELEQFRIQNQSNLSSANSEPEPKVESMDSLVRSIRTLTVKIPTKPEGWGFFFQCLERAFATKNVPEMFKSEILLNLLGEKAARILTYMKEEELKNYTNIKEMVLKENEPTAQICWENFKKTNKLTNETYVQFATRLVNSFDFYLSLRKVTKFEDLKELIISDKIYQCLDKETAAHISVRQMDSWFKPLELGKEIDLFFTSLGKSLCDISSVVKTTNSNFINKNSYYNNAKKSAPYKNVSNVFMSEVKPLQCILCAINHPLFSCEKYKALTVSERNELVKKQNLCFNCISSNSHKSDNCKSKYSCKHCFRKHHTTLHFPRKEYISSDNSITNRNDFNQNQRVETQLQNEKVGQLLSPLADAYIPTERNPRQIGASNENFTATNSHNDSSVLLSTAICYVKSNTNQRFPVRCLLDSGASRSFLTQETAERLNLNREKTNMLVSGLNETVLTVKFTTYAEISNRENKFIRKLKFLIIPRIADLLPSRPIDAKLDDFSNLKLSDENFHSPGKIDMLIGAEIFYELLKPVQIKPLNSNLILQETVFGFVVSGSTPEITNRVHCGLIKDEVNLNQTLEKFWNIENIDSEPPKSKEVKICEEHFQQTHARDKSGKYVVKMPLKDNPENLGKSKAVAVRKLETIWKRLVKDPEYEKLYCDFLSEYENLGHMKEVETSDSEEGTYYIPHFGIYNPQRTTTKLRVVFNASSETDNGLSLNSLQYNGGMIQDDLLSIMIRFRKHIFAFAADIEKMFRMIWIHPEQRKLQRILWKKGPDEEIKTYELTTVSYGTVSAPFLAQRTLKQLALDEGKNYPLAEQILENDFYMDDCLSGAESVNMGKEVQKQLTEVFKKAGMTLHKWKSNDPELLMSSASKYEFSVQPEETRVLGILWDPRNDSFLFNVNVNPCEVYTKRSVLSTIAKIFDPLGLLGPVVCKAKIFMQRLWVLKLNWNDPLPEKEATQWHNFIQKLPSVSELKFKRCIISNPTVHTELHGFSDASQAAYGATIYCKTINGCGEVNVQLISSKSRVAPVKQITIPRLELCSAELLAKLITKVKSSLKISIDQTFLWSDSMIVLAWLQKEPHLLKTFISNRIARIQDKTLIEQWHHVSSEDNPSDLLSRGVDPDKLIQSKLWFNGPDFLRQSDYPSKQIPISVIKDSDSELKSVNSDNQDKFSIFSVTVNSFLDELFSKTNNFSKLLRVMCYILRFIENCKSKVKKVSPLNSSELCNAELKLVKLVQGVYFNKEISHIKKLGSLPQDTQVRNLNPFLDKNDIFRVGGRLSNSDLSFSKKFPILLPANCKLTSMIIEYYHCKYLHVGPQNLLFQVRQKYWPINGRNMCRKIVHKCVLCFKAKPVTCQQLMGDLPKERVSANLPFICTGIDFCGPFQIKYPNQRKGNFHKVFISIFVCFSTKAVHLELLSDLTAEAFVATLKRFFARRGKSCTLFSDNAKNFVGSNTELKKLFQIVSNQNSVISNYLANENVEWRFIPPRAPNFGGLWEAGVKSIKFHLKRVVGKTILTYVEFLTIVNQIEGILNSRPLTPLSSDPDDLTILSPGHFLIGRPLTSIIEPDLSLINTNRLNQYQKLTKMVQTIWRKWSDNYLTTLQQRSKWCFDKNNVNINDLVLVKEDNLAVCQWQIGRVTEVCPGKDNKIRVVFVKTKDGVIKRPISKICLLPIET